MKSDISNLYFGVKPNPSVMDGQLHELQGIPTSALCGRNILQLTL